MSHFEYNYLIKKVMPKWEMIKEACIQQSKLFSRWDKSRNYWEFHHNHYDWWAFPIDQPSSKGDRYQVGELEIEFLSKDREFIEALKSNAILVCKAWGYDLVRNKQIQQRTPDQRWHEWPIRLYKMTLSLEIFRQIDLFLNAVRYGNFLLGQGYKFSYGGKNLKAYFIEKGSNKQEVIPNEKKREFQKLRSQTVAKNQIVRKSEYMGAIQTQMRYNRYKDLKRQIPGGRRSGMQNSASKKTQLSRWGQRNVGYESREKGFCGSCWY